MNRFTRMTEQIDADLEQRARAHTARIVAESKEQHGSSRLPAAAGAFAMQDRDHPEAYVAWADAPYASEQAEQCLHVASAPPTSTIVHLAWPPKAERSLTPRVEQAARDFDTCMRNYTRSGGTV